MAKTKDSLSFQKELKIKFGIIGRTQESAQLYKALKANRHVLIEGPVGVGKTKLAAAVSKILGKNVIRIDGDTRFTEQKLTGWFDPALVLKKGYSKKTFIAGPLVQAMQAGSVLFINELNRMPEAVQNVLLPALDEGLVSIPQMGMVKANDGFIVVATQNPREFVATSHLSEALMDRMEWVSLHYQSFDEEVEIVQGETKCKSEYYKKLAVHLVRATRNHTKIKRGASVRAAIAIIKLMGTELSDDSFIQAVKLALPTRIELNSVEVDSGYELQIQNLISELIDEVKKKS